MKAVVLKEYGPPENLKICDVPVPDYCNNEILVKVFSASVNFGDVMLRNFRAVTPGKFSMPFAFWLISKFYFGILKPGINIPGNEFSGIVMETGGDVKLFKQGDRVYGFTSMKMGSQAEYIVIPETGALSKIPGNISFDEAAGVPYGALMAMALLRKLNKKFISLNGKKILVIGAAGNIGSAFTQLAGYHGAEVTGMCRRSKADYLRYIGAADVIEADKELPESNHFDIIIDITGKWRILTLKKLLNPKGCCYFISFKFKHILQSLFSSLFFSKKFICISLQESVKDLDIINILLENGDYKPVVDRCFTMDDAGEANRYFESGNRTGSVILKVSDSYYHPG